MAVFSLGRENEKVTGAFEAKGFVGIVADISIFLVTPNKLAFGTGEITSFETVWTLVDVVFSFDSSAWWANILEGKEETVTSEFEIEIAFFEFDMSFEMIIVSTNLLGHGLNDDLVEHSSNWAEICIFCEALLLDFIISAVAEIWLIGTETCVISMFSGVSYKIKNTETFVKITKLKDRN